MEKNVDKIGAHVYSRIFLFHGNVLEPHQARLVNFDPQDLGQSITLKDCNGGSDTVLMNSSTQGSLSGVFGHKLMKNNQLPEREIVFAFNYSCCCLHKRQELVLYFKHALSILNKRGGIFVMDLYGGTSSECELRMQRRFPNFTYIWEQAEFDVLQWKTRISLHFNLQKQKKKLRHAFSYSWRLCRSFSIKKNALQNFYIMVSSSNFFSNKVAFLHGDCRRSETVWKRLDFNLSTYGFEVCQTVKKSGI